MHEYDKYILHTSQTIQLFILLISQIMENRKRKSIQQFKYNIYRFWGHMLLLNISKIGQGYFSNVTK